MIGYTKSMHRFLRRYVPTIISLLLVAVLIAYAPWKDIGSILSDFDNTTIAILIILSLAYYLLKTIRFCLLLQAMDIHKPIGLVALSYLSAQPISLLPAGEIYRSHALKQYTGVPIHKSIGQFTTQGILEGAAMAILLLISALALGTLRLPAISLALIVGLIVLGIRNGYIQNAGSWLNRLPFVHLTEQKIERFSHRNQAVLSRTWLPRLFGLSVCIELVGAAIAYTSVAGIGGHINIFQAVLVYAIPIIIGFVSLLPGGIGISEQSAIGVLLLADISVARAVAATLIMRVTIVGMGVLYGLIALTIGRTKTVRQKASTAPSQILLR